MSSHLNSHDFSIHSSLSCCHFQGILDQLHRVVLAASGGAYQVARELAVLSELAVYCKDGEQASTLVDILVHFLKTDKRLRYTTRYSILVIITKLVPLAPDIIRSKYLSFFSSQFGLRRKGPQARQALCQLFKAFAAHHKDLVPVADILEDLNAFEENSLDEYDFNRRSKAAAMASEGAFDKGYTEELLLPIVWHMLHDLFEDELSLRIMASRGLAYIATKSGKTGDHNSIVHKTMFTFIRKEIRSAKDPTRSELIELLGAIATAYPKEYGVLARLRNTEGETDFYTNITHLQVHRRCRALAKLQKVLADEEQDITQTMLSGVLVPLVTYFVFNAKAEKEETLAVLQNKAVDNTSNLVTMAVKTLGSIASR